MMGWGGEGSGAGVVAEADAPDAAAVATRRGQGGDAGQGEGPRVVIVELVVDVLVGGVDALLELGQGGAQGGFAENPEMSSWILNCNSTSRVVAVTSSWNGTVSA